MIKQALQLEVKIGERIYSLHFPVDGPLGEIHDALFQMRSFIVDRINQGIQADKPKPIENPEPIKEVI